VTLSDSPKVTEATRDGVLVEAADPLGIEQTTLRQLVEAIGSPVLHVLAAPKGLEFAVRSTVLHDPIDPLTDEPDAILLMAGLRADSAEATSVVRSAADHGYSTVVVKRRGGDISDLVAEASIHGITVLAAADEVSWRHLDALLASVLGAQGVATKSASGVGDELFALANAIAAVIGGSVAIEDMDRRVVAYSSSATQRIDALRQQGILDRRVPDMDRNPVQYRAVLAATGVVRFAEKSDELARAAIAIKAGAQPLGTIWAIEGADGLDAEGERTLIEGARLAALKILRALNASGLELQLREAALLLALDGSLTAHEVGFRLSLPGGADLALVGFATLPEGDESAPLITHVASALARYVAAYRPDAAMATTSRAVYVLLPGGGAGGAGRFAAGALTATQASFANLVRGAIAFSSSDPSQLPAMRREIDDILRVTTTQRELPGVARLSDVHTRVLLAHVADELVHEPRLRHPGIDAMIAYDHDHGTEYAESITAWLGAVGDIAGAASELGVHPNTLRYRLRRADELFDISLAHPDDRLSVWMQLRLR
jgi:PucR C-terminal helix-turn-helix domain